MTTAHEDAEHSDAEQADIEHAEAEHSEAESGEAAQDVDVADAASESPAVVESEFAADTSTASTTEDEVTPQVSESRSKKSKVPQVTRVIASVALLAATASGIGIASGWGAPSEPLSVAPPTAYNSGSASGSSLTVTPSITDADPTSTGDASKPSSAETTVTPVPTTPETTPAETLQPKDTLDITTPSSLTVLVNKQVPLDPADYAPDDLVYMNEISVASINQHALRHDAALAVKEMFEAAAEAGHVLDMTSGYRDYDLQTILYDGYVMEQGQEAADATSARPGYSEHQTGLAADISAPDSDPFCILQECFGETAAGQWLAEHAWEYGYILRYPDGETAVTGYEYEPWHFRFVGVDAAAQFHESGETTYEEFLGVESAPDYD